MLNVEVLEVTKQLLINGVPLTDLFTVLTFAVLIVTIIVSAKALKESTRSNILSSAPVLILQYNIAGSSENDMIWVKNVGHGAALNIRIDNCYTSFLDEVQIIKAGKLIPNKPIYTVMRCKPVDLLLAGDSATLDTSTSKVGGFITTDVLIYHTMKDEKELVFHFRYSDISNKRYISKVVVSKNSIRVLGSPKPYSLFRMFLYVVHLLVEGVQIVFQRLHALNEQQKLNETMASDFENPEKLSIT